MSIEPSTTERDPDHGRDYQICGGRLPSRFGWLRVCQLAEKWAIAHNDESGMSDDEAAEKADIYVYLGTRAEGEVPKSFALPITCARSVVTKDFNILDGGGWDDDRNVDTYDVAALVPVREIRRVLGLRRPPVESIEGPGAK